MTEKQKLFIKYYSKDPNATKAAISAGYSEKCARDAGSRLLTNPDIKAKIGENLEKRAEKVDISAEMVIKQLVSIAFADLGEFLTWGAMEDLREKDEDKWKSFVKLHDFDKIPKKKRQLISEISETNRGVKIKLESKIKALELLGKYFKLFTEKHEHSGEITHKIDTSEVKKMSDSELKEAISKKIK